jgi:hypothetical protein
MRRPSIARLLGSAAVMASLASRWAAARPWATSRCADRQIRRRRRDRSAPRREVYGERYRANPKDADAALGYGTRCAPPASVPRPPPCWSRLAGNPATSSSGGLRPRARRQRHFQKAFDVLSARTRPTIRTGASSRYRARRWTRWASTRKPAAIMRARCVSRRTSPRCCPISACPMCSPATCRSGGDAAQGPGLQSA